VEGRDFELQVLQPASGLDAERLLVLLEEAEAARLVGAVPGELSRWRFAHALVREVLYEGLLAARRVRLHGLIVEALEAVYTTEPGPHLAELAHHLVEAAPGSEEMAAKAVQVATLAGRRSLELLAWEDATGLFERALAALELTERSGSLRQRCELLLAVGEARMAASDVPAARADYQQAGELARRIGLGLLDLTLSLPEQALRRFQRAAALADRMQARPMVAMSREGQARALLALDRPGDREQATALLDEVTAAAQALGIRGLAERADVLRTATTVTPRAPSWPAGLTSREVEVLRLIAAGYSNRAIAQALFISPNTVLHHVSSIFAKLGVANHAEAAAYAIRLGLAG
jgi:DNA-binding NarL/FixJ family response regulator